MSKRLLDAQIETLERLIDWASRMGGFESSAWDGAARQLARLRKRRDAEAAENAGSGCPSCGSRTVIYVEKTEIARKVLRMGEGKIIVDAHYEVSDFASDGKFRCDACEHEFKPEMAIEFV